MLALLQSVAAINIVVDPFGVFGLNKVGLYFNAEREFKQQKIYAYPHDGLLLGNSKVAYIDPDDIPGHRFFNAAFSGAKPEEMLTFLENHLDNVETVIIGLDFRMLFTYEEHELELTSPRWTDWFRYSLSFELLDKSFEALDLWRKGEEPLYKSNGARTTGELLLREFVHDQITFSDKLDDRRAEYDELDLVFSDRRIEIFREIKRLLEEQGIALGVFMNPLSDYELEAMRFDTRWQESENYHRLLATLREIFPTLHDYTTEYRDPSNFWVSDYKHYRPALGARLVRETLERIGVPPEPGTHGK